jgi:hypothetical protein
MTQKKYFFYNSKTLQFEEVKTPFLKKLLKYGSVLSLLTIYIWLTWSFFTPKFIKEYIAQKSFLKKRIQKSNKDLDQMTFALNSLMTRDNDLYRSKLELNKIDERVSGCFDSQSVQRRAQNYGNPFDSSCTLSQKIHSENVWLWNEKRSLQS